jgi:HemY protein
MRTALTLLVLLFAGVIAAHFLFADRGQVLVTFHGWTLQTSVPVMLLMLVAAYVVVRLIVRLVRMPRNIGRAVATMRENRARDNLAQGLLAIDTGDWERGERLLGRSAHDSDKPVLHYLAAARAADRQGATDRRDRWLELAAEHKSGDPSAVLLTRAESLYADAEYELALATLQELQATAPDKPSALALQARAMAAIGDWGGVLAAVPKLRKLRALPAEEIDLLEARAHERALAVAVERGDASRVRAAWRAIGRNMSTRIELQRAYAKALADAGDGAAAEEVIRQTLKSTWDPELVELYGELDSGDPPTQLKRVEEWLPNHAEDSTLLLAAARLCMRNELWGKARSYLEASLGLNPRPDAYELYGKLLEQLGERERAAAAFRSGLALATADRADRDPAALTVTMPVLPAPGT